MRRTEIFASMQKSQAIIATMTELKKTSKLNFPRILIFLWLGGYWQYAYADIFWMFREVDGTTNWQYIANSSSGILIIALSAIAVRLYFSRRQVRRYNQQLEEIRAQLEQRVRERTASLKESHDALQVEIDQHRNTTGQLQHSEAYLNSILQSMPLMLIGLDKDNRIIQWNRRAEAVTGLPADQTKGGYLWDIYPSIAITPKQISQAQQDNKALNVKYSQRGQYHFNITIYPLMTSQGAGAVVLLDDVTQRVNHETRLIQQDKMSAVGEMAAVMAHDINIPLKGIIKDIKNVRQGMTLDPVDNEGLSELLEDAVVRGQQATAVLSNLIDFSAASSGEKTPAHIPSIINHSLDLASDVLSVTAGLRFRDIEIDLNYADNLPEIPCHIAEMQQVVLSLFRHCCHALNRVEDLEHQPKISIEVTVFYDNLWIRIQHNGVGIGPEQQRTIFEPFDYKSDSSDSPNAGNHLSFSNFIIVEEHQGQIAVTSDPEIGTTFHIQLPLA